MLGVSDVIVELLSQSVTPELPSDALIPILDMGSYYVSKTKQKSGEYAYMFPVEVDDTELHAYIRL